MTTSILLLAAGASARMGQSKQLLSIGDEPMLRMAVRTALTVSPHTTVVLGAHFEEHKRALKGLPINIIENRQWQKGIGCSIKAGMAGLKNGPFDAVMVLVCDQPNLTSEHLKNLIAMAESQDAKVVASSYAGTTGVPALFKKEVFEMLRAIDNEAGAKKIIQQLGKAVALVDFPGGEADLDTPDDYQAFLDRG